jgi:uncharacterized protein with FMN-binding domain
LALSSAVIVTVYSIGYVNTHSSLERLTATAESVAPSPGVSATAATAAPPSAQSRAGGSAPAATPTAPAVSASVTLRDGSYTGTGNSRHGGLQATVVVSGGKIVSAAVTSCHTRYPCTDVDPLVRAAVQNQGVPTTNVSGATDSSRAYKQAVSSALAQARAGI